MIFRITKREALDSGSRRTLSRVSGNRSGIGVFEIEAAREFSRETADREAVATVRGDVQFDDRVTETEQLVAVRAGFGGTGLEHQDARMVFADTEFRDGADHAVGHLAVRLASGDFESAGQHRAGQRNDDEVTLVEIARATDDATGLGFADLDLAEADRLLELGQFGDGDDLADDQRAVDRLECVEFLDFESHPDEPGVQLFRGHLPVGSCPLQDLGQPGLRYSHVCSALSFVDKSL